MDGRQAGLRRSLQLQLSCWLALAILVVAALAGLFSFVAAFDEAHELQDDLLRQVAAMFEQQRLPLPFANGSGDDAIRVQRLADAAQGDWPLPQTLADGMQSLHLAGGRELRVFVRTLPSGERLAVAQLAALRDEIARDGALHTVMPLLVLVPLLLLLLAVLVRRAFRPLAALAEQLDRRGERELQALAHEGLASEVQPIVAAFNRLLERVDRSMQAQQRFVADAAHELRSPMTALSLQAERLAGAEMGQTARVRLQALREGIDRGRHLLDQLLHLARAQAAPGDAAAGVSVQQIYRQVLEALMPLAEHRQIDIGIEGDADAEVAGNKADLGGIVRNLVDNAIRYTPPGGRIDLSVRDEPGATLLLISDSGPGIAPAERARVFDPFHRVLGSGQEGSGLGLAIVKALCDRLGASVELADASSAGGLRVTVRVPRASGLAGTQGASSLARSAAASAADKGR